MILYYDFEGRRVHAEVTWPKNAQTVYVQLADKRLLKDFPADLLYDRKGNNITYIVENPANKRLTDLQKVIGKRLQEMNF